MGSRSYTMPLSVYWIVVVGMFLSGFGVGLIYANAVIVPAEKARLIKVLTSADEKGPGG